eukprot:5443522-Prymnesium_polylepis.1
MGPRLNEALEQGHVVEVQRTPRDRELPHLSSEYRNHSFRGFITATVDEKNPPYLGRCYLPFRNG